VVVASIMRYVLLGLQYVHKNGGIHRDIKVTNSICFSYSVAANPACVQCLSCHLAMINDSLYMTAVSSPHIAVLSRLAL
jgi:serine/threonine protein kinase